MESGDIVISFVISADALHRIFVFLLYIPVSLLCFWRLCARMSTPTRRMAAGMLAAQVLLVVMNFGIRARLGFESWLWGLGEEYNIPSILASTLLMQVCGVAVVTAYFAKTRPGWQRIYLVGIGLIFLILALDEQFAFYKNSFLSMRDSSYPVVGVMMVVATAVVALRSPRLSWKWHISMLAGLALLALGGLVLDFRGYYCGQVGFLHLDRCLSLGFEEEVVELFGSWLVLVAMLGQCSDAAPTPTRLVRRALYAFPALWILMLFLNSFTPRLEFSLLAQSASVRFESGAQLQGYHIDTGDDAARIRLYVSARQEDYLDVVGYSIFLMDQSTGDIVLSQYAKTDRQHGVVLFGPDYAPVYRQSIDVSFGQEIPVHRAIWIALALRHYVNGENETQSIVDSDHQLLGDRLVVLGEFILPTVSTASRSDPLARFDNEFILSAANMPTSARAGEILPITFTWRSDEPGQEDLVQFLHLGNEETGTWWVHDQQPLGSRLPTRLWYSGLADSETWQVPLPADLMPGRYLVFTGLYRTRDLERIPTRDADGTPWLDARVPLGILIIEQ